MVLVRSISKILMVLMDMICVSINLEYDYDRIGGLVLMGWFIPSANLTVREIIYHLHLFEIQTCVMYM